MSKNTRSGVNCEIIEENEKQLKMFSNKVTTAVDFTDDAVVQCEFDVPVVKHTSRGDGDIQMFANKS